MALKLAIIGTGKVAREEYVPFLAGLGDVTLGYWNRTAETAQALARQFPGAVFGTLEEAAAWGPAAALVLTSERARLEVSRKLIELGVPRLFLEKPLVAAAGQAEVSEADFAAGRDLLRLAKQRGCQTAIVFNYRFFEQTLAAKAAVAERDLGRVTAISALVHFACWSHALDLIRHFAGDIAQVTALAGQVMRASAELKIQARDVAGAFVTEGGATGTIVGTLGMAWEQPLFELTLAFERGRIHMRDLDGTLEILAGGRQEAISLVRHRSRWDHYSASFKKAVGAYVQTLREGLPPPVPAEEGLRELQFEAGLKRSMAEGRAVVLAEAFPVG